jgi:hypothetical protein
MRHFRAFCPVTALPLGMGVASTSAGLVALSGCAHAVAALLGCALFAVAVATITAAAHQHRVAAASAQVTPGRWLHLQMVADGGWAGQCLVFREILTPATSPSRARGATSVGTCNGIGRCRACFMSFYGKVGFYSLLGCLATGVRCQSRRPHIHSRHPNHRRRAPWGCLHSPFGLLPTPPWRASANSRWIPLPPDLRLGWQPLTAGLFSHCFSVERLGVLPHEHRI